MPEIIRHLSTFATISGMRVSFAFCQFLIIFELSRVLTLETLGLYSLYTSCLALGILVLNLNYHVSLTLQVSLGKITSGQFIGSFFGFLKRTWPITLPALLVLVSFVNTINSLLVYWAINLILMSLNCFSENFLIAISRGIKAAAFSLCRNTWILAIMVAGLFTEVTIEQIFLVIIAFEFVALLIVTWIIYSTEAKFEVNFQSKFSLIQMRGALFYSCLALLLLLSLYAPRFLLDLSHDASVIGLFHLYFVMFTFGPNLLESILLTGYISKFIEKVNKSPNWLKPLLLKSFFAFAIFIIVLNFTIFWISEPLFEIIRKSGYTPNVSIYLVFSGYSFAYLSMRLLYQVLYARSQNLALFTGLCLGFFGSLIFGSFFIAADPMFYSALSLLVFSSLTFAYYFLYISFGQFWKSYEN